MPLTPKDGFSIPFVNTRIGFDGTIYFDFYDDTNKPSFVDQWRQTFNKMNSLEQAARVRKQSTIHLL